MFTSLQNHFNKAFDRVRESLSEGANKLRSLMKIGPESSLRVRRRQFFWGGCLVVGGIAFAYGVMNILFDKGPAQKKEELSKPVATNIATIPNHINMDEARWHKLDMALTNLSAKVSKISKTVYGEDSNDATIVELPRNPGNSKLAQRQEGAHDTTVDSPSIQTPDGEDTSVHDTRLHDPRFQEIRDRLAFLETQQETQKQSPNLSSQNPNPQYAANGEEQDGRVIQKLSLSLISNTKNLKTVETTIPAGAFAKTVLLSGLDASSSMSASSDPRPMLLRIVDHGTLPRRFQSDLKDCHCTAGAYGDLSSERVYARLEKLTCVERSTGEIIETQVAGYVAGSDGKAGIRGVVASRDGQFLARSLMGGIFSGLSNVANSQNRKAQVNPFFGAGGVPGAGSQVAGPTMAENFTAGMAGGATSALDRLSQYYIDRAEQLQPVIQIAAGQVVDIVFTEGTFIGSQTIRSDIEKNRDNVQQASDQTHQNNYQK
ncbi:MAG: hypothetical protein H0X26_10425 [Alphaproteobacteria bacterium]|nr:hypothetical protein [Alphaproteobacteria bacterium]